jgi:hypothetical protein
MVERDEIRGERRVSVESGKGGGGERKWAVRRRMDMRLERKRPPLTCILCRRKCCKV